MYIIYKKFIFKTNLFIHESILLKLTYAPVFIYSIVISTSLYIKLS